MKRIVYLMGILFTCASFAGAQVIPYIPTGRYTLIDEMQIAHAGKGRVVIDQPASIRNMIGTRLYGADLESAADGHTYLRLQGYRVQVFSGNDARTSKDEAFRREREIKEAIPHISTYVTYTAPFWKLRVGDFSSHEEAYFSQRQLMQSLQQYGKEMYIVREDIKLAVDDF